MLKGMVNDTLEIVLLLIKKKKYSIVQYKDFEMFSR